MSSWLWCCRWICQSEHRAVMWQLLRQYIWGCWWQGSSDERMLRFWWGSGHIELNNFKSAIHRSPLKLQYHVTMLNFEFPNMEIHCSSFPPHHQVISLSKSPSSPVSVCFCPSPSTFSILTALFVCSCLACVCVHPPSSVLAIFTPTPLSLLISSLCVLSSVFVHILQNHTPFASSSPGSAYHLPSSTCSTFVCTFILPPLCLSLVMCWAWPKAVSQPGPALSKLGLLGPSLGLSKAQGSSSGCLKPLAMARATALVPGILIFKY
jgi:hypothetical protein